MFSSVNISPYSFSNLLALCSVILVVVGAGGFLYILPEIIFPIRLARTLASLEESPVEVMRSAGQANYKLNEPTKAAIGATVAEKDRIIVITLVTGYAN